MYQKETGEIIIGIDHGYSTTKTVDVIMKNGVKKCKSKPAMEENTLLWKGSIIRWEKEISTLPRVKWLMKACM